MDYFTGLARFGICVDVRYATVDRKLEFVGSGWRLVEAEDRRERAATEQGNQHPRTDDARRCFTGSFYVSLSRSSVHHEVLSISSEKKTN